MSDVSKIWLAKMDLLFQVYLMFPSVTWYVWADAGLNEYRLKPPPPHEWPKRDLNRIYPNGKFIYVQTRTEDKQCLPAKERIMGGTVFLIHNRAVREAHSLFYESLKECMEHAESEEKRTCCSDDQIIFFRMRLKRPHLFSKSLGKGDWSEIIKSNY